MNKRTTVKIIVFGLIQWFILLAAIFVASLIFSVKEGAEMTAPPTLGFVIVALVMVGVSWAFARRLKLASRKLVIIAGLIWSAMTTVFLLVTVLANGTQDVFFNGWGAYLLFFSQAIGAMLVSTNQKVVGSPSPAK